jgi:arsenate reductase
MSFTIFHNPRCSKSRQTLELLQAKTKDIVVVEYLKETPSIEELKSVIQKLGVNAHDIVRTKEDEYKALNIDWNNTDEALEAIVSHPKILERPIVFDKNKAIIGRPPENVNKLF